MTGNKELVTLRNEGFGAKYAKFKNTTLNNVSGIE
jgi:hypothetical protein